MQTTHPYDTRALMPINAKPDTVFVRGEGAWIFDADGRRYLDWVQGWAVNCLGHAPRAVVEAIARQAATLINPSPACRWPTWWPACGRGRRFRR